MHDKGGQGFRDRCFSWENDIAHAQDFFPEGSRDLDNQSHNRFPPSSYLYRLKKGVIK